MDDTKRARVKLAGFLNLVAFIWAAYTIFKDGFPPVNPFDYDSMMASAHITFYIATLSLLLTFERRYLGSFFSIVCFGMTFLFIEMATEAKELPYLLCMIPGLMFFSLYEA